MRIAAVLMMILLLFPACRVEEDFSVNIALSQEPPVLDVMLNSSISGKMIAVGNIYEKLLVLDEEGRIRPELASFWTLSEDGKSLSFTIREGVPFHNGDMLEAEDVAASMNRWLDSTPSARSVTGGSYFTETGPLSVEIKGEGKLTFLPVMIASSPQSAVIMPAECIEQAAEDGLVTEFIGTGPYMFSAWRAGEYIELCAFADYKPYADEISGLWGRKDAGIETLRYYFVPDEVTREMGFEGGIYDAYDCVSSDYLERLEEKGAKILQGGENGSIALVFNKKEGVALDQKFRQAVSLIADRDTLMRACYGDSGFSIHSGYMEKEQSLWSTDREDPYSVRDPERGKELLASSSYDGSTVRILSSNLTNLDKIAIALASSLESEGIDADVTVLDWASFIEKRKDSSSWDIYVSAMTKVPLPQLKTYLSPSFPGWFGDGELLERTEGLNDAGTLEEASMLWNDLQADLWEYVPVMIPGHYSTIYAVSGDLEGVIISDGFYFWNAYRDASH